MFKNIFNLTVNYDKTFEEMIPQGLKVSDINKLKTYFPISGKGEKKFVVAPIDLGKITHSGAIRFLLENTNSKSFHYAKIEHLLAFQEQHSQNSNLLALESCHQEYWQEEVPPALSYIFGQRAGRRIDECFPAIDGSEKKLFVETFARRPYEDFPLYHYDLIQYCLLAILD